MGLRGSPWSAWSSWHHNPARTARYSAFLPYGPTLFRSCHHYWSRPPSRLFWFLTGALSAAAFINCHRDQDTSPRFKRCWRPPVEEPSSTAAIEYPELKQQHWRRKWEWQHPSPQPTLQPQPPSIPTSNPWDRPWGWGLTQAQQERLWQEEMDRMHNAAKQAGEAMSELSETTLDSVLKAVESLTDKLAAHSEARKRHQEKLQGELDDIKNNPPKLV